MTIRRPLVPRRPRGMPSPHLGVHPLLTMLSKTGPAVRSGARIGF